MAIKPNAKSAKDRLVTVCDKCLQASCWQAKFFCDNAETAGTIDLPVSRLRELDLEHESYWGTGQ